MPPGFDAVYAPFAASLRAGGFGPPADGESPAELVAAHIARNNDLIAAAAEQVAAGQEVSYDNESGVDDAELARYAQSVGGLAGLAREVERSAARLEQARDALGDRASTPVQVIIRDHGQIVRDGPMTIGAFIEGNASFHLALHLEQLKALELAAEGRPARRVRPLSAGTARTVAGGAGARRGGGRPAAAPAPRALRQDAPRRAACPSPVRSAATTRSRASASTGPARRTGPASWRRMTPRCGPADVQRAGAELAHREGRHRVAG